MLRACWDWRTWQRHGVRRLFGSQHAEHVQYQYTHAHAYGRFVVRFVGVQFGVLFSVLVTVTPAVEGFVVLSSDYLIGFVGRPFLS